MSRACSINHLNPTSEVPFMATGKTRHYKSGSVPYVVYYILRDLEALGGIQKCIYKHNQFLVISPPLIASNALEDFTMALEGISLFSRKMAEEGEIRQKLTHTWEAPLPGNWPLQTGTNCKIKRGKKPPCRNTHTEKMSFTFYFISRFIFLCWNGNVVGRRSFLCLSGMVGQHGFAV